MNQNRFAGMSADEAKALFRQLSRTLHPDAGGSHDAFVALNREYDDYKHGRIRVMIPLTDAAVNSWSLWDALKRAAQAQGAAAAPAPVSRPASTRRTAPPPAPAPAPAPAAAASPSRSKQKIGGRAGAWVTVFDDGVREVAMLRGSPTRFMVSVNGVTVHEEECAPQSWRKTQDRVIEHAKTL